MTIWNKKKPIKCYVSYDGLAPDKRTKTGKNITSLAEVINRKDQVYQNVKNI